MRIVGPDGIEKFPLDECHICMTSQVVTDICPQCHFNCCAKCWNRIKDDPDVLHVFGHRYIYSKYSCPKCRFKVVAIYTKYQTVFLEDDESEDDESTNEGEDRRVQEIAEILRNTR